MKNKSKITIIVISFFVAFSVLIIISMVISSATPATTHCWSESLDLTVQGVSQDSSFSNVSLSIFNCGATSVRLDKIQMEGTSVLTYVNGAEIIDPSQMSYNLNFNSSAQVNLIVPNANYTPDATIIVYTPEAMYYQRASVFNSSIA